MALLIVWFHTRSIRSTWRWFLAVADDQELMERPDREER